jgi:Domain of unknown function (DUF1707)
VDATRGDGGPGNGGPGNGGPGNGGPGAGVRASDAERDATVERLSQAAGEGRLTLEEFSQRMEQATTARTRAELDRLVTDLPASAEPSGAAVSIGTHGGPSWHVTPVGGLNVFGPWRMGRHVIVLTLVGGARLDLSQAELAAPDVTLTKVSLVGGVRARIPRGIRVDASGLSLIGGTQVEGAPDPGPGAPTIHIRAFSLVGGIRIRRTGGGNGRSGRRSLAGQQRDFQTRIDERRARIDERRARLDERRNERGARRARRDRSGRTW